MTSWNAVRFAGGDHVESYFFKATAPDAERALWLKATIFSRRDDPGGVAAEGWAIAFDRRAGARHVAVKHSLPLEQASFASDAPWLVDWRLPHGHAGDESLHIEDGRTAGAIAGGEHRIEWDLAFDGDRRPFVMLPYRRMYTGPLPSSKTVTPSPDVRFSGSLRVDGAEWAVDGWRGMQGHNWGRGHAEQYAWCHCNQFDGDDELVLEAVSARVRVGPVLTPVLTVVYVRHRGVDYAFNALRSLAGARGVIGSRGYTFEAHSRFARVKGIIEADTEDFVGLYYPNPSGAMTHCLNSKLARARVWLQAGRRPEVELSSRACALELATRRDDHGVKMYV